MTDAPLDLKISVQLPNDHVEALESYFYECEPNPWVLIQKTVADPYYLNGYFNQEDDCTQAIADNGAIPTPRDIKSDCKENA